MLSTECQGTVVDCLSAPVYEFPETDSDILGRIKALNKVVIYLDESTNGFYKICTATSLEGYCEKKYIALPL